MSFQRSQICCPAFTVTVIVDDRAVRFAAAFPSRVAAVDGPGCGLVKSSGSWSIQFAVGVFASVIVPAFATWYWKSTVWAAGVHGVGVQPPARHSSPV